MRNIVRLRSAAHRLTRAEDASGLVTEVLQDLRADAGETVPKASAARILGVSTTTLNKWVSRGLIPVRPVRGKEEVVRSDLEELAEEVRFVRRGNPSCPGVIALALRLLAARGVGSVPLRHDSKLRTSSVLDYTKSRELRSDVEELAPGERVAQAAELSEVLTSIEIASRSR